MTSLDMLTSSTHHKENESNENSYLIQNQSNSTIDMDDTSSSQPTTYDHDNNNNNNNSNSNNSNNNQDSEVSLDNGVLENLETSKCKIKKRKKRTLVDEKLIIETPRNKKQTPPPQLFSLQQQAITNTPYKKRKYTKKAKVNKTTENTNKYQEQENQEKFEVEAIIQHVLYRNRVLRYIVKWKNYPDSENTREPASILHEDCRDLCIEYWKRQPLKEPLPDNVKSTFGLTEADKYGMEQFDLIHDRGNEEQEGEEEEHYQFSHDHQHQYFEHQEYNDDSDVDPTFTNQRKQKTDQQSIEPSSLSIDSLFYTQPNDNNYSNIDLPSDNESFDSLYFDDDDNTEKEKEKEKEKRNGKMKKGRQDKDVNENKKYKNGNHFEDQNGEHENELDDDDDDDGDDDDDDDDEKDKQCYRLKYKQKKLKKDDMATSYRKNGYEWAYTKSPDVFDWKRGSFKIQTVLPLKNRVTQLLVYIEWSEDLKTVHFVEELHEKAPVKLCLYFQERIRYEN